jgi:glycosyltransferase involved in cell wall biosynthesis
VSQRLRIGYIVPQFPGQTHDVFWREIQALEALGHDVFIFSTARPDPGQIPHDWTAQAAKRTRGLARLNPFFAALAVARLLPMGLGLWAVREGGRSMLAALRSLSASQHLMRLARHHKLDHIHVHTCGDAALVARFARALGAPPYSMTMHQPLAQSGPLQRQKWANAGFVTAITHRLMNEASHSLDGSLPERLLVRPLGVDTDWLEREVPFALPEGRPLQIFSCGHLSEQKGHQDLLSTTRQLLDQGVDVRVEIAGDNGSGNQGYRQELDAQLKKLRLNDHVKLLGAVKSATIKAKLEDAHLFVLVPRGEHQSVAYIEAMSMGVPTVGADCASVRELIEDSVTGYLVEPRNPGMLARTIRALAQDPDALHRLSGAGRTHVLRHYRAEYNAQTLVDEIARLTQNA